MKKNKKNRSSRRSSKMGGIKITDLIPSKYVRLMMSIQNKSHIKGMPDLFDPVDLYCMFIHRNVNFFLGIRNGFPVCVFHAEEIGKFGFIMDDMFARSMGYRNADEMAGSDEMLDLANNLSGTGEEFPIVDSMRTLLKQEINK
ncbi:hypothetical protein H8S90_21270 [Olivibacter sp. SDN3]|uniref:hypothetical protein n=1 Tax=Olivibacter sp. SDN3 TaxID=2764720 RepID=UPI001650F08B|nr:hypothetical protein [Olivibacter sp. SDN3]QNL49243.1 hypothetical protein H8S90_21270 [Olivibacter sp. SDN3]